MVKPDGFAPARGDIVWLQFNPRVGHEQSGRRPALVVSPEAYNRKVGLALMCPITARVKGYPFEVLLPEDGTITGAILADQIKSLDWKTRGAEKAGEASAAVVKEVLGKIGVLVG